MEANLENSKKDSASPRASEAPIYFLDFILALCHAALAAVCTLGQGLGV